MIGRILCWFGSHDLRLNRIGRFKWRKCSRCDYVEQFPPPGFWA